eukprot:gene25671-29003_t
MSINMRVIGFCGMDDSVSPDLLALVSSRYPWVEWGVLFRNDLEGTPRYPSRPWVERLSSLATFSEDRETVSIRLAGHLCGNRCQEVLDGDFSFIQELYSLGYRRVQVNATAANSVTVDPERINQYVQNIFLCMRSVSKMEFIIQCNEETKPIYTQLMADPTPNMSVLYDASCGKGVRVSSFPSPMLHPTIRCGYAGGIGPDSISEILTGVRAATEGVPAYNKVWVDMESSLRTIVVEKNKVDQSETRRDVFSIDKVFACILIAEQFGMK